MKSILKNPITILMGITIGVLIGLYNKPLSQFFRMESFAGFIEFPGKLYLFFLQMTVIPIIISAIAAGLGNLMRSKSSKGFIQRMIMIFIVFTVVCAAAGMVLGVVGKPGLAATDEAKEYFGYLSLSSVTHGSSAADNVSAVSRGFADFFTNLIPSNIFDALSAGNILAIVFFSIMMGIAIGFLHEESALLLLNFFSAIFYAFQKLVNWSLYLLPFGLIFIVAGQIAAFGLEPLTAMYNFVLLYGIGAAIIFIICTLIIWAFSGISNPIKLLSVIFEPVVLAFASRNSAVTLPSAINCMQREMKFNSTEVNITLPLGITFGRFGNILFFALGAFFVAQVYGVPLEPAHFLIIFFGSILAGTATAGMPGIASLYLLGVMLKPLNLPLEAVLVIFIAIDPIIDPVRTVLVVYVNMAITALLAKRDEGPGYNEDEKQLLVFIQEIQNRPPLLIRKNGILGGVELSFIKEIGRRWKRQVVYKDAATMNAHEREWMKERADIIAGIITKDDIPVPPAGLYFSRSWASAFINGDRKQVYFLMPEGKKSSEEIDEIIKTLQEENYLKFILAAERAKGNT